MLCWSQARPADQLLPQSACQEIHSSFITSCHILQSPGICLAEGEEDWHAAAGRPSFFYISCRHPDTHDSKGKRRAPGGISYYLKALRGQKIGMM